jgi:type IV pilus assembly protein PilY1
MKRIITSALTIMAVLVIPLCSFAEDTDMFGGESVSMEPNILIVFDNSGSMDESITVGEPYDPNTTYTCSACTYDKTKVYYQYSSSWIFFADIGSNAYVDKAEIDCNSARSNLNADGEWGGQIKWASPHQCTNKNSYYLLRTGNYLNYTLSPSNLVTEKKLDIAKREIINVIKNTPLKIRWGLMVFNYDEGGYIVSAIKDRGLNCYYNYATYADIPEEDRAGFTEAQWNSSKSLFDTDLIAKINAQTASTWTPLAETLAEAGRYYAGAVPYYGKLTAADVAAFTSTAKTQYKTPIDYRCRSNNVIIITDGEPTHDKGALLTGTYLNSKSIGDKDGDNKDPGSYPDDGSDYLDDVAEFLYNEDLILRSSGLVDSSGVSYGTYLTNPDTGISNWQHVYTYAIGFRIDTQILRDTCDNGQGKLRDSGDGTYFTTNADIGLASALRLVLGDIVSKNSSYTAPVVPISRANKTYAGNSLYIGLFSPVETIPGFWRGNLKKFGFYKTTTSSQDNDILLDRYAQPVTVDGDGMITDSVLTAWYQEVPPYEGMQINYGGVGKVMYNGNGGHSRIFKTNKNNVLVDFNKTNILPENLGFTSADTLMRDDLIDWVRAEGVYAPSSGGAMKRTWLLGDILHSRPAILYDDTNYTNVIFVGANDGFLHCFVDNEGNDGTSLNYTNDTVYEAWSFTPWDVISRLKYLPPENSMVHVTGDSIHDIFVDGSPTVYTTDSKNYVAFGLRRGGNTYYSLNITNYTSPLRAWEISSGILGTGAETLGESWSTPLFSKIKIPGGSSQEVLLFAGGYDTNQDKSNPGGPYVNGCTTCDKTGKAIFAVNAATGALVSSLDFTYGNYNKLTYSIIDLIAYDDNDDDCDDVIYAVSLGGDVFAFNDMNTDGTWDKRWLFHASQDGSTSKLRKLFYAPGIAQETWGDWVYVGSGDREDPLDEGGTNIVTNRLYAIKNKWKTSPWITTWTDGTANDTLTDSDAADLVDVTADILQTSTNQTTIDQHASDIEAKSGWYITLEFSGEKIVSPVIVYDKVAYFTTYQPTTAADADPCTTTASGTGRIYAVNYKNGNAVYDSNADGALTKTDRIIKTGKGMAPEPKIVITPTQTYVVVSMEGTILIFKVASGREIRRYFWQQQ